jgi:hypothetical protein
MLKIHQISDPQNVRAISDYKKARNKLLEEGHRKDFQNDKYFH